MPLILCYNNSSGDEKRGGGIMEAKYQEWLNENPLYQFRQENDLTRSALAGYLRLSVSTIQFWETAGNVPNDENMHKLADLFDLNYNAFKNRWYDWLDRQPPLKLRQK